MSDLPEEQDADSEDPAIRWLRDIFTIDTRSLAAMRIGIGIVLVWEAFRRVTVYHSFFTETGPTPSFLFSAGVMRWQSLYLLSTHPAWPYVLFALQAVFGLMLALGYRTRLATLASLVLLWSQINRNYLIADGGYNLICWFMIWSLFLPLGASASVDQKTRTVSAPRSLCSIATAGILLQLIFVYWVAFAVKMNPMWHHDFTAVHYFLRSYLGTPLGRALTLYPWLTTSLTVATLALELFGPILALVCAPWPWVRTIIVAIFILFHLGLAMTLYIASFGWMCIAAWLVFLPGPFWAWLERASIFQILRNSWNRMTRAIAALVDRLPGAAVRCLPRDFGYFGRAVTAGLLVFMIAVNTRTIFPGTLGRLVPARLPDVKQRWGMMDVPWQQYVRMVVEAQCFDGTKLNPIGPSLHQLSPRPIDYLWPPEDGRLLNQQILTIMRVSQNPTKDGVLAQSICTSYRLQWNQTHSQDQRIVAMQMYIELARIRPPSDRTTIDTPRVHQPLYTWVADGSESGRSAFPKPE